MRYLLHTIQLANLVQAIQRGRETSVQAENFLFYDCGKRKVIKEVSEVFPNIRISVFPQALIIETIHLCDLARLMISTEDSDAVLVANLQAHQESDCLD
jgi:hypothetical protein